jgi:hypothetical protein
MAINLNRPVLYFSDALHFPSANSQNSNMLSQGASQCEAAENLCKQPIRLRKRPKASAHLQFHISGDDKVRIKELEQ